MEFMHSRPDIIRSENQRCLIARWNAVRGTATLPPWQALQADALPVPDDNLSFLDVVASNGSARFLITFHGAGIGELYGSVSCVGKFLDEILPPSSRDGSSPPTAT